MLLGAVKHPNAIRRNTRIRLRENARIESALDEMIPARRVVAEAERAREDAEHAQWVASGARDDFHYLLTAWQAKRTAQRAAAEAEFDALHRWIREGDDDATPEQLAAHEAAIAAWHKKHDHLFGRKKVSSMPVVVPFQSPAPQPNLVQSSAEFTAGFTPPEYLVDGVLQRRFCYSLTAQTGVGKTAVAMLLAAHVESGRRLGALEVAKGSVLYFAGENPTDIQMRWLGLTREMGIDSSKADVHFVAGAMPLSQVAERITAEVAERGLTLALVVVDTSAAYDESEDENSNTQAATHAKRLRSLTMLPGGPCVVVLCHPTKRAADDDLIPRGGGAFLAEVDGNVALRKREALIVAAALGKFRGPEFEPLTFTLKTVFHPALIDTRKRDIPTVVAQLVGESEGAQLAAVARRHEDLVLKSVEKHPDASLRDRATLLGWRYIKSGKPDVAKVDRALKALEKERLVQRHRGGWQLTSAGEKELNRLDLGPRATVTYPMIPGVAPLATVPPVLPRSNIS